MINIIKGNFQTFPKKRIRSDGFVYYNIGYGKNININLNITGINTIIGNNKFIVLNYFVVNNFLILLIFIDYYIKLF